MISLTLNVTFSLVYKYVCIHVLTYLYLNVGGGINYKFCKKQISSLFNEDNGIVFALEHFICQQSLGHLHI